jgi:predicted secreted acid phosphatase
MRHFIALLTLAAAFAAAPIASAQDAADQVPAPQPVLIHLGSTPVVQLSDGGGGLPYLGASNPYNAGALTQALTQFHDTGVYDREIGQIDALARQWVVRQTRGAQKARAARRAKGHDHGKGHDTGKGADRKPALVLDIDETSLSNWSAIVADGFVYGPKSQAEAVDEIGTAIAPTLELYTLARSRGVAVFFITGRPEAQRAPTEDNLKREGFTDAAGVVLKPADFKGSTVAYKSGARAAIEQQGYRIIASVGDQYSDLAGGHEARGFKLPNPFYYLP